MIDPRKTFDRTTTPRVQDETNYNYNFSQNVPFYPFLSLNRIMLTYPSLTNTKFHLEKKKKKRRRKEWYKRNHGKSTLRSQQLFKSISSNTGNARGVHLINVDRDGGKKKGTKGEKEV